MRALLLIFLPLTLLSQTWTEPVQISSLQGLNNNPDFCIDKNGTIHCVWSYKVESNYKHIYYSKSVDDGQTWSDPENVSQNTSMWMENPHIVSDTENKLHLTYDINVGNPGGTLIVYRKFDGQNWSNIDTVSTGWPGARHNRLVIDNNDKLYCFWFHEYQNGTTFYRVLENGIWEDILIPYNNYDLVFFMKGMVDSLNNIYCTGGHHFNGQSGYEDRIISFNFINGEWSDYIQLSDNTSWGGNDIALSSSDNPAIIWRQNINDSIPPDDGTLFSFYDGENWSIAELIAENATDQAICIDKNNEIHLVDNENFSDGYGLVHYQLINNSWVGEIINEDNYGYFVNKLISQDQYLYLLNLKVDTVIGIQSESTVMLRKYEITTNTKNDITAVFDSYKIYPNPSSGELNISYSLESVKHTSIKIYDLQGKLLNTILERKQAPGKYQIMWNGTDKNGKVVETGIYLVRLQSDMKVCTKRVVYVK